MFFPRELAIIYFTELMRRDNYRPLHGRDMKTITGFVEDYVKTWQGAKFGEFDEFFLKIDSYLIINLEPLVFPRDLASQIMVYKLNSLKKTTK